MVPIIKQHYHKNGRSCVVKILKVIQCRSSLVSGDNSVFSVEVDRATKKLHSKNRKDRYDDAQEKAKSHYVWHSVDNPGKKDSKRGPVSRKLEYSQQSDTSKHYNTTSNLYAADREHHNVNQTHYYYQGVKEVETVPGVLDRTQSYNLDYHLNSKQPTTDLVEQVKQGVKILRLRKSV